MFQKNIRIIILSVAVWSICGGSGSAADSSTALLAPQLSLSREGVRSGMRMGTGAVPSLSEGTAFYLWENGFASGTYDAAVFFDVDLLRNLNTLLGKENADYLLQPLLQILAGQSDGVLSSLWQRRQAYGVRRGGDEFAVAFHSGADRESAVAFAGRIKQAVESVRFAAGSVGILSDDALAAVQRQVSVSGGNAVRHPDTNEVIVVVPLSGPVGSARTTLEQAVPGYPLVRSALDGPGINNVLGVTLSTGVALAAEMAELSSDPSFAGVSTGTGVLQVAAFRKDVSKEAFVESGYGPAEGTAAYRTKLRDTSFAGSSTGTDSLVNEFSNAELSVTGGTAWGAIRYFNAAEDFRAYVSGHAGMISEAGLFGFSDTGGTIDTFWKMVISPDQAKNSDIRFIIRDIKMLNEAFADYGPADVVIAVVRVLAQRILSEMIRDGQMPWGYEVVMARGGPGGPRIAVLRTDDTAPAVSAVDWQEVTQHFVSELQSRFNGLGFYLNAASGLALWVDFSPDGRSMEQALSRINEKRKITESEFAQGILQGAQSVSAAAVDTERLQALGLAASEDARRVREYFQQKWQPQVTAQSI